MTFKNKIRLIGIYAQVSLPPLQLHDSASAYYYPPSQIKMDPGAVQAAQILSSFRLDDFLHQKLATSPAEPLTIAPGDIQYVLTPNSFPTGIQVIHPSPQQVFVQHFNQCHK